MATRGDWILAAIANVIRAIDAALGIAEDLYQRFVPERQRSRAEYLYKTYVPEITPKPSDPARAPVRTPDTDILDLDTEVHLIADLPGVKRDDIDIELMPGSIKIKAEAKTEIESEPQLYKRRERGVTAYERSLDLPEDVIPDKAKARFNNGVLEVIMPRKEPVQKVKAPKVTIKEEPSSHGQRGGEKVAEEPTSKKTKNIFLDAMKEHLGGMTLGQREHRHLMDVILKGDDLKTGDKSAEDKDESLAAEVDKELTEEITEATKEAAAKTARYTDLAFYTDGPGPVKIEEGNALQVDQPYRLEVAVRISPTGTPFEGDKRRRILEPAEQRDSKIMVTAVSDTFEINEPVQTLILPASGDSKENAWFSVRPLKKSANLNDLAKIRVRLYYEFNLLDVTVIEAEVVDMCDDPTCPNLGGKRSVKQERLERDYVDLVNVQPRVMHIDITHEEEHFQFNFAFCNAVDEKIVFTAPAHLTPADLEDDLVNVRKIWYDIAMSTSYSEHLEGDKDEFVTNIRRLAAMGQRLWGKLFRRDRASALFEVGKWLESHPLEADGIIQVSTDEDSAGFVFPWSLLYDRRLPNKEYELPDLQGFWGVRYCVEQTVPNRARDSDAPVKVDERLKVAFMLWKEFRNADQQEAFFESLETRSAGRLVVNKPPLSDAKDCLHLLETGDCDLLYFYTHGHTRHRQADIGVGPNLAQFTRRYEGLEPDSPLLEIYKPLYESIKQGTYEPDRSWIELSTGKIYLDELEYAIESLKARPFVFLNMCESAQVTPNLGDSFVHFFLDRGARGVIGTECPMTVEFALPFAEKFLTGMCEGQPVGKVLLDARRHFLELSNPLGLAYTLFGSATVRLEQPPLVSV